MTYHCGGVILYSKNFESIFLVETPDGNFGFPKGKRNKNETINETCIRECHEETGISSSDIFIINNLDNVETKNGRPITYYLYGFVTNDINPKWDPKELKSVKEYSINNLPKLETRRSSLIHSFTIIKDIVEKNGFTQADILLQGESMKKHSIKVSKFLSWILRHGIHKLGLEIDQAGYVKISDLLQLKECENITLEMITYVVSNDEKERYDIKDGIYIRPNQGHTKDLKDIIDDNEINKKITLEYLDEHGINTVIHGTKKKYLDMISYEGLKPMDRIHVHLALDINSKSGIRKDNDVLIYLDIKAAIEDGYNFYLSQNDVILCPDIIKAKYITDILFI